ncbi:hypothetical protein E2C01_099833 [Portunus trituberculatus]|uniref:Uncharacterized protein n=1 Tax=Portunus trituberculatus TaxID=210409 RepID=A0A5B7KAJ9_PORTR|nr:hypothetical protein [Portunus trituberculatus]
MPCCCVRPCDGE